MSVDIWAVWNETSAGEYLSYATSHKPPQQGSGSLTVASISRVTSYWKSGSVVCRLPAWTTG